MKSKDIFWGVVLVGIGLLFLLRNFDIIHFDWYTFRTLWPVLIILLGVALLPINGFIRLLLAFLIVIGSIFFISGDNHKNTSFFRFPGKFSWDLDKNDQEETALSKQQLYESFNPGISNAVLQLEAVAGKFETTLTKDYLLKFEKEGNLGKYELTREEAGSSVILNLNIKEGRIKRVNNFNKAVISLHPDPIWDIAMDAGAADVDFNLEPFKVERLEIDGGAASIKIRLGSLTDSTNIRIDAGATSILIEIPESSGCEIHTSTILTSHELDGFSRKENNVQRTENFDESTKKIFIRIDAAISSFIINRY
ncbi:MAG: hypothetical protein EOM06_03740 [Sphingobacteriia bacterium]|nr:hypothetical protein [Sphingobacteriia bacterium]